MNDQARDKSLEPENVFKRLEQLKDRRKEIDYDIFECEYELSLQLTCLPPAALKWIRNGWLKPAFKVNKDVLSALDEDQRNFITEVTKATER